MGKKTKSSTEVLATLVQFDSRMDQADWVRVKYAGVPFTEVQPLVDYKPHGGTPLLDAVGKTITLLDKAVDESPDAVHIAFILDESGSMGGLTQDVIDGYNEFVGSIQGVQPDDSGGRVMLVVFTDGMENASVEYTRNQVTEMIQQRESANWTTVYMGADQDAWSGAAAAGMSNASGTYQNYAKTSSGLRAGMMATSNRATSYIGEMGTYPAFAQSLGDTVFDPGVLPDKDAETAAKPNRYAAATSAAVNALVGKTPEEDKA